MPINLPDTWGTKKQWPPLYPKIAPVKKKEKKEERLDSLGRMKCPSCGQWIKEFWVSEGRTEFGTIDDMGRIDYHDSDCDGFEITCPECNREVFHSDTSELEEYYHPSP